MNRRGFLRLLGGAAVAAAAPTKTFAFFGKILRSEPSFDADDLWKACEVLDDIPDKGRLYLRLCEEMQAEITRITFEHWAGIGDYALPTQFRGLEPRYGVAKA